MSSYVNEFDSSGHLIEQDGYDDQGVQTYANHYDGPTGRLTEQDGYDSSGRLVESIVHNADGTAVQTLYDANGHWTERDNLNAAGVAVTSIVYAADASYVETIRDATGHEIEQDGFTAQNALTYRNVYDATNGALIEQDGYSPAGTLSETIVHNADGTAVETRFSPTGVRTERDTLNAAGVDVSSLIFAADASYTLATRNATGAETGFYSFTNKDGLLSSYSYDPVTGRLLEQDSYYATGHLEQQILYNDDGSATSTTLGQNGGWTERDTLNAGGYAVSALTFAADASYTLTQRNATGHEIAQYGFTNQDVPTYRNLYDAASGRLTEQDGYSAQGVRAAAFLYDPTTGQLTEQDGYDQDGNIQFANIHNSDGSERITGYNAEGAVIEQEDYDAQGNEVSSITHNADGSTATKTYVAGVLAMQTVTDAAGATLGVSTWTAGTLTEQDSYDGLGHKIQGITYHSDGSWVVDNYNMAGALTNEGTFNAKGQVLTQLLPGSNELVTFNYVAPTFTSLTVDLSKFTLSFDDEFNGFDSSSDGSHGWQTSLQQGQRTYPLNNLTSYYSDTSVGVNPFSDANGVLTITANRATAGQTLGDSGSGLTWTSGTISTFSDSNLGISGRATNFSQEYGYFEMRAQLPAEQGFWPAFWLLPADGGWPPELDILEQPGNIPTTLYQSVETAASGKAAGFSNVVSVTNTSTGFHTYGVDWEPDTITWYVDGKATAEIATPDDMHQAMYIVANLAVGAPGSWSGTPDALTNIATMQIDYIRAYVSANTIAGTSVSTAADGTSIHSAFDPTGRLIEQDRYNAARQETSITTFNTDGTSQTRILDVTTGLAVEQDGFDTSGQKTYANLYTAGVLTEQDAFSSAGTKTQSTVYAADGSYVSTSYAASGAIASQNSFTSGNTELSSVSQTSGGYSLIGYQDNVRLVGTTSNDTFTGGGVNQTFAFSGATGVDTVTNFHAGGATGHDTLEIDHALFADFNTLLAHTHDVSGGADIVFDAGDSILLQNVHTAALVAADFHFV